jgi:hypothetical protein
MPACLLSLSVDEVFAAAMDLLRDVRRETIEA